MLLAQYTVLICSLWLLFVMIRSVVRTLVVPRPAPDLVTGILFLSLRHVFEWRLRWARTYQEPGRGHGLLFAGGIAPHGANLAGADLCGVCRPVLGYWADGLVCRLHP